MNYSYTNSSLLREVDEALIYYSVPSYSSSLASFEKKGSFRDLLTGSGGTIGDDVFLKHYHWNERFQILLEKPTSTPEEALQRFNDIHLISRNLAEVCRFIGVVLYPSFVHPLFFLAISC
jgi:hypothetical protein